MNPIMSIVEKIQQLCYITYDARRRCHNFFLIHKNLVGLNNSYFEFADESIEEPKFKELLNSQQKKFWTADSVLFSEDVKYLLSFTEKYDKDGVMGVEEMRAITTLAETQYLLAKSEAVVIGGWDDLLPLLVDKYNDLFTRWGDIITAQERQHQVAYNRSLAVINQHFKVVLPDSEFEVCKMVSRWICEIKKRIEFCIANKSDDDEDAFEEELRISIGLLIFFVGCLESLCLNLNLLRVKDVANSQANVMCNGIFEINDSVFRDETFHARMAREILEKYIKVCLTYNFSNRLVARMCIHLEEIYTCMQENGNFDHVLFSWYPLKNYFFYFVHLMYGRYAMVRRLIRSWTETKKQDQIVLTYDDETVVIPNDILGEVDLIDFNEDFIEVSFNNFGIPIQGSLVNECSIPQVAPQEVRSGLYSGSRHQEISYSNESLVEFM